MVENSAELRKAVRQKFPKETLHLPDEAIDVTNTLGAPGMVLRYLGKVRNASVWYYQKGKQIVRITIMFLGTYAAAEFATEVIAPGTLPAAREVAQFLNREVVNPTYQAVAAVAQEPERYLAFDLSWSNLQSTEQLEGATKRLDLRDENQVKDLYLIPESSGLRSDIFAGGRTVSESLVQDLGLQQNVDIDIV